MTFESIDVEERLARHIATLRYEDLSQEAITAAEGLLLDTVVDMAASLRSAECRALRERWSQLHGAGACSVIGRADGVSASSAAFLNGVFAHWFEWDDVHNPSILHASAVVVPVMLAAAEAGGLGDDERSGHEFIAAFVAAFDVAARASEALVMEMHNGWMPTGNAVIGAAGGAARLLGLDADGIRSAMGIAASTMGAGRQAIKDQVSGKNVLCGLIADAAVRAALLAQQGIMGSPGFLFGPFGAATLFTNGKASKERAVADLGQRFSVTESSIKVYPCCQSTHGCIDSAFKILNQEPAIGAEIEKVALRLPRRNYELVGAPFRIGDNPRVSAQFYVAFTVALALGRGAVRIDDFNDAAVVSAADTIDLANRTDVSINDAPVHEVRLHLRDGSTREAQTTIHRGKVGVPPDARALHNKFEDALSAISPVTAPEQLASLVSGVALRGLGPLTQWMREARLGDRA